MKGSSISSTDEPPTVLQLKEATFEYDTGGIENDLQISTFRLERVNMEVKKVNIH